MAHVQPIGCQPPRPPVAGPMHCVPAGDGEAELGVSASFRLTVGRGLPERLHPAALEGAQHLAENGLGPEVA